MNNAAPPTEPSPAADTKTTLRQYASELITARLLRMLAQAEGVSEGRESEPIHQMRVWSRRSRAALEVFRPCFAGKAFEAIEQQVKQVTQALGAARDLDVMIETLGKREAQLPAEQQAGVESFLTALRSQRQQMQKPVEKSMSALDKFGLQKRFTDLATEARSVRRGKKRKQRSVTAFAVDPNETLQINAERIIAERLSTLFSYAPYITDPARVTELHEMRIAAKRLRYTLEIFEESVAQDKRFAPDYRKAIETVRMLQEHLGEIHDADVLVPRLSEHLGLLLHAGYGTEKNGELRTGVHLVDFHACLGILTLCSETRDTRERRYIRLLRDWDRVQEANTFDRLRALLHQAAHPAPEEIVPVEISVESVTETPPETIAAPPETEHGQEQNLTENRAAAPAKRSARRPRRSAAPASNGHSGTGSDTPESAE